LSTTVFESISKSVLGSWSSLTYCIAFKIPRASLLSTYNNGLSHFFLAIMEAPRLSRIQMLIPTQFKWLENDASTLHLNLPGYGSCHRMLCTGTKVPFPISFRSCVVFQLSNKQVTRTQSLLWLVPIFLSLLFLINKLNSNILNYITALPK